jgi:phosphoribosyl 1,2-cyclic phosphate phosphodiesterase
MRVEILGSAGALATPRPGCGCHVCAEAGENGIPFARTGPSVFVHGPDVLVDTPEESREQLSRAGLGAIRACLYSHWHPDHVMGRRVWESLHADFRSWPPSPRGRTTVYLPQQVAEDFRRYLGTWDHLAFLAGVEITPLRVAQSYVYAFVFEEHGRRLLIAMDELKGWDPPAAVRGVDLAVLPMGICEHDPFTGGRLIAAEHPILRAEATFDETLEIVRRLAAGRVVLSRIEELDGLSYLDLLRLEERLRRAGVELTFAFDGLSVEL